MAYVFSSSAAVCSASVFALPRLSANFPRVFSAATMVFSNALICAAVSPACVMILASSWVSGFRASPKPLAFLPSKVFSMDRPSLSIVFCRSLPLFTTCTVFRLVSMDTFGINGSFLYHASPKSARRRCFSASSSLVSCGRRSTISLFSR